MGNNACFTGLLGGIDEVWNSVGLLPVHSPAFNGTLTCIRYVGRTKGNFHWLSSSEGKNRWVLPCHSFDFAIVVADVLESSR